MRKAEKFEAKSGNSCPENTYANMKDLEAHKPDNNPKAEAMKITQDRFTLVLVIFFILMFLILVIFISLAFVYYDKVTEEVSRLMNSDMEKLKKEVNELKSKGKEFENKLEQHKNDTKPSCAGGWLEFEGHCYFFSDFELNWTGAQMMCLNRESHLVIITSEAEQRFLLQHLNKKVYWMGMTDVDKENQFRWVDGTLLSSYKLWNNGEPNNFGGKEHCASFSYTDKWNDNMCDNRLFVICEKDRYDIGFMQA